MPPNEELKRDIEGLGGGWELKEDKVVKSFHFSSFMKAIEFVNDIAKIAEKVNHHPIITINWRTVKISLKSFDVNAITKRDINLAKEIEKEVANSSTVTRSEHSY
jgi:4a-hydroxytetrahydrobiopterin dehydratase